MSGKWADSLNSLKRRQVLLSIPMQLTAHADSKHCLTQQLAKTGASHICMSLRCEWKNLSIISLVCDFTDIHFEKNVCSEDLDKLLKNCVI